MGITGSAAAPWIVLALAFITANLPFLFDNVLFFHRPASGKKAFGWRLLELGLLYLLVGIVSALFEKRAYGSIYPQSWEFYVATFCLFLVFAFPGFVYCVLWRRRQH
jgi:hypothetical protein